MVPRSRPGSAAAHGFTLIELVLATALLALGLAIAFGSLHSATGSVRSAEAAAARNEHLRAVQATLYRYLESAQPLVLLREESTQQVYYFQGKSDSARFVAPMPGYMSRGGPYVVTLRIAPSPSGHGSALQFAYAMLIDEQAFPADEKRPAEQLLDGISEAHFEYRGIAQDGKIGEWQTEWRRPAQLPLEVRMVLRFSDPKRPWPAFVTALPLGYAQARADDNGAAGQGANP